MNVTSIEPTELLVSWIFEHNLTSYFEVMWSPPNEMTESSATTNDTSYIITALTPRTSYTVCVQAMDANDTELGYSADVTATTATPGTTLFSSSVAAPYDNTFLHLTHTIHRDRIKVDRCIMICRHLLTLRLASSGLGVLFGHHLFFHLLYMQLYKGALSTPSIFTVKKAAKHTHTQKELSDASSMRES